MFIIIGGDGKEYGPVTADQIRTWITAGRADLDTKAKALGTDEWRRVGDFAEFSGSAVPPMMNPSGTAIAAADTTEMAGRGQRIGGAIINAFFYLMCTFPGSMMVSRKLLEQNPELAKGGFPRIDEIDFAPLMAGVVWVWVGILVGILLQAILLAVRGQNIGKMLVGVRVVHVNGGPAGFVRGALLRFILPVLFMIGLNMGTVVLGFVFLLVDFCFIFREDARCLHDLIAGTKVVKAGRS